MKISLHTRGVESKFSRCLVSTQYFHSFKNKLGLTNITDFDVDFLGKNALGEINSFSCLFNVHSCMVLMWCDPNQLLSKSRRHKYGNDRSDCCIWLCHFVFVFDYNSDCWTVLSMGSLGYSAKRGNGCWRDLSEDPVNDTALAKRPRYVWLHPLHQ